MLGKHTYCWLLVYGLLVGLLPLRMDAQTLISWENERTRGIEAINVFTGEHIVYLLDHIDTLETYAIEWNTIDTRLEPKGHLHTLGGKMIASFDGMGLILEIDTSARRIVRLDNTYQHGYNFGAYHFVRNDTLYSWSGYGFWNSSNVLTYYSFARREWNKYQKAPFAMNNEEFGSISGKLSFYDRAADVLFVFGETDWWSFDFQTEDWKPLGKTNLNVAKGSMSHRISDTTYLLIGDGRTHEIWPAGNEYSDVTMSNKANTVGIREAGHLNCAYEFGTELLIPKFSQKVSTGVVLEYVPRFGRRVGPPQDLYEGRRVLTVAMLLTTLGILFVSLLIFVFALRNRFLKRRSKYFSDLQWRLIDALMEKQLTTEDLNTLLDLDDKSWEVQRRKRSDFIKELNALGKSQFDSEVVIRIRNENDKRQIFYAISPAIQPELARLM